MNPQWSFLLDATRTMFSLDMQTFLDMIPNWLNFAVLAAFMTYLLYKPVLKVLHNRANRVESDILTAAKDKKTAEELKTQYEQKVRDIELERSAILDEARKTANDKRNSILEEAKAEAQDLKNRANRDIASERERVKDEVHQAIVDISADMAAKLVAVTIDKNAHDKLFNEAMAELEATVFKPLDKSVAV